MISSMCSPERLHFSDTNQNLPNRSAYYEKHQGGEPNFTNYSWTKDCSEIGDVVGSWSVS